MKRILPILFAAMLAPVARGDSSNAVGTRVLENPTLNADMKLRVNVGGVRTDALTITGATGSLAVGASVRLSLAGAEITQATADATDNGNLSVGGGGAAGVTRGATINLRGNEASADPGDLYLRAGNVTGGGINFEYGNAQAGGSLSDAGKWTLGTPTSTQNQDINGKLRVLQDNTAGQAQSVFQAFGTAAPTSAYPVIVTRAGRGTLAAPQPLQNGDGLALLAFVGSKSTTPGDNADGAYIESNTTATWNGSSSPANLVFKTTPAGSVSTVTRMTVTSTGGVNLTSTGAGSGGNVPHNCSIATTSPVIAAASCTVTCPTGRIAVGGGCVNNVANQNLQDSWPAASDNWTCQYAVAAGNCQAKAICCDY